MSGAGLSRGRRIVSLWFPTFATDLLSRRHAEWRARPFATIADGNVQRIVSVNAAAQANGIAPGMTLADARALLPSLAVMPEQPGRDARALGQLAEWCTRYTPWSAVDRAGQCGSAGLWLDITGCAHLFGGEMALAGDLVARLGTLGFSARAGIADTPGAAWAWARFAPDANPIVPPAVQREAIAPLAVAGLRIDAGMVEALHSLGLRRIGDLYAFPRASLPGRFGALLLQRLDQALGNIVEPLSPRQPPIAYRAAITFAEPISEPAGIAATVDHLLRDLCAQLARRDQGGRRFDLTAYRCDGTTDGLRIGTGSPSRDPAHLARLFAEKLEKIAPGFGIDAMALTAPIVETLPSRQAPLAAYDAASVDLTQLFDVLGTRLGHAQVMRLATRASHIPERAVERVAAASPVVPAQWPDTPRPLRLFQHPQPIEASALLPDEPPFQFVWRGILHRVARAQGPERIAGEWWRDHGATRDYYRVEDADGRRFWIYRDNFEAPRETRWFLHGLFG
jgi:protein ImuB